MTARIFIKLIFAVMCVLVVALVAVDVLASRVAERTYVRTLTRELQDKAKVVALAQGRLASTDQALLVGLAHAAGGRITIIARDGRVVAGSEA